MKKLMIYSKPEKLLESADPKLGYCLFAEIYEGEEIYKSLRNTYFWRKRGEIIVFISHTTNTSPFYFMPLNRYLPVLPDYKNIENMFVIVTEEAEIVRPLY
jgi:hypothetical protein